MNSDHMFEAICSIRMHRTHIEKERILIDHESTEFRRVIEYTLNPYKKYFMKKLPIMNGMGSNYIGNTTFRLLDRLANRTLSGHAARSMVYLHAKSMTPRSAKLFEMMLLKNFDAGIGTKFVNRIYAGLVPDYQVMKAETWDPKRFKRGSFVGVKLDGIRATYRGGEFWTRSGRVIIGLNHLTKKARDWELKGEWDGELDIPFTEFNKASGIIRSNAHAKPSVRFTCFDLPLWDGSFRERQDYYYSTLFPHGDPMFRPLGHHPVNTVAGVLEHFQFALDQGQEGIVIKRGDSPYSRKRSWDWMKLKCGQTVDATVLDYREGVGKFAGMIGKLVVQEVGGKYVHTIGVGKMTQEDQKLYFGVKNFRQLENQKVEVAFMERQPSGDLRHGRFSKFLWDR